MGNIQKLKNKLEQLEQQTTPEVKPVSVIHFSENPDGTTVYHIPENAVLNHSGVLAVPLPVSEDEWEKT